MSNLEQKISSWLSDYLTDNNLGDEGAVAISIALTSGLSIKTLTLPSNKIGVDGITALSKALNVATKLTSVQLENNIIGDEGTIILANALVENNGEVESAIDWLRKKGIAKANKKSSRVAAEGLVGINVEANSASIIEANCESWRYTFNKSWRYNGTVRTWF